MKKILALVLVCMLAFSGAAMAAEVLKLGTNVAFPPYEFYDDETGEPTGIDIEIARVICEKLGYGLEVVDMAFDGIIPALSTNKIDFTMAGLTVTEERKQSVDFSTSYATGIQVVIVKEDSAITSVDDLFVEGANHKIGVQMGTTGDIYCSGDIEEAGLGTIERYANGTDATMALVAGKVDCVVIDNEPAKNYVAVNEGLKILETAYTVEEYAAAFPKGSELTAKYNAVLEELIADGTVQAIIDQFIPAE